MGDLPKHPSRTRRCARRATAIALVCTPLLAGSAFAASPVPLGVAGSFALLAGSTITNAGPTTVTGDIGLCCTGLATPGFGSLTQLAGAQHVGPGSVAATAQNDLDAAYANAAGQAVTNTVPVDLSLTGTAAHPLLPGVYQSTAHGALQINTGLTLDFGGDPNAVFIFQGTSLTTAVGAGGSVTIVNGGGAPSACNIYWQLSDATQGVTLGAGSAFKGTTMALGASVLGTAATVEGRILTRRSKAVTLEANTVTRSACSAGPAAGGAPGTKPTAPGSTPGSPPPSTGPVTNGPLSGAPPSGAAHLSGPKSPVNGPFVVSVTGHAIKEVVFFVDGHRVGSVSSAPGRTKFKKTIRPGRDSKVHRVTARVTFKPGSRTPARTLRLVFRRRPVTPPRPRFTG
jgi:ice-binding like protein